MGMVGVKKRRDGGPNYSGGFACAATDTKGLFI